MSLKSWKIDYTDDKDEWIKANPNALKLKKWEEFKNMIKKRKRTTTVNVGFMENVIVPVDISTNLASIDVTELMKLYKERGVAIDERDRYLRRTAQLKEVNNQLVESNEEIQKENAELKEENERLINKNTNMKLIFNSVYGLPKGCDCHICCVRHAGQTAFATTFATTFAKAAESLAKHLEAGKPTYDQLLEENEKLQAEVDSLQSLQYITRDENTKLKMEVVNLREMNKRVCEKNKELEEDMKATNKAYSDLYESRDQALAREDLYKSIVRDSLSVSNQLR